HRARGTRRMRTRRGSAMDGRRAPSKTPLVLVESPAVCGDAAGTGPGSRTDGAVRPLVRSRSLGCSAHRRYQLSLFGSQACRWSSYVRLASSPKWTIVAVLDRCESSVLNK